MMKQASRRRRWPFLVVSVLALMVARAVPLVAQEVAPPQAIVHKIQNTTEQMEMTVNTSRILVLDQKIPQAQVNNPDVLELTPLSPNEIQVSAKSPGVTQINLWDENKRLYTVNVIVYGDVQRLSMLLQAQFPNSSLKVIPVETGVLISGYVDKPENVNLIVRIAEEFFPKVIDNMTVSGVQQVLLQVKVMEVSRTKLRRMGIDWTQISNGNLVTSAVGNVSNPVTFNFTVINGANQFLAVLRLLREDKLMKILAEPNIVAVSGEAASFLVGGEIGYQLNAGITGPSVEFKDYGTQIDFVAIVLGNGRIRLQVCPTVSEVDRANSIGDIPALKTRTVDTTVELHAGQTLALAGLVQNRVESENRGLPWVSEVPYLGVMFREVQERINEVELLILVTPQLVDPLNAQDVPACGPGTYTTSPDDCDLYLKGHVEVPKCCSHCEGSGCPECLKQDGGSPTPAVIQGTTILRDEGLPAWRPAAAVPAAARAAPANDTRRPSVRGPSPPGLTRPPAADRTIASQSRHTPPKPKGSPPVSPADKQEVNAGFIGPIGYDVLR